MVKNIVIIGGGPVGLIGAIMLYRKSNQAAHITILEKRKAYTRQQVVVLDGTTITNLPFNMKLNVFATAGAYHENAINLMDDGCYVWPPLRDFYGYCDKTLDSKLMDEYLRSDDKPIALAVKISKLEKELEKWIRKYTTIKIVKPIETLKLYDTYVIADETKYPYDILIGADGVNSQVRQAFFGPAKKLKRIESYGLAMIIKTKNNKRVYRVFNSPDKTSHGYQSRVRFFRQTDYSVYLALQLSPAEAAQFTDKRKIPDNLKPLIRDYLKIYDVDIKCKDLDSCIVDIALFPIEIYYASKVVDAKGKRFLVGDAAMTTHFFTGSGLNRGVEMFQFLSNYIFKEKVWAHSPQIARHINIKDEYIKDYNSRLQENKNMVLDFGLDFDSIEKVCETKTLDELKEMAKKVEMPTNLPKSELCYLLANF